MSMTIRELAAPHGPMALKRIIEHIKSDNPTISMTACQIILDRAYGRPVQAVESKSLVAVIDINPLEIARKAAFLLNNAVDTEDIKQIN